MKEFCIILPAVKKNVAFPDDLIKKLNGITLLQRALDKAASIAELQDVYVVTDSEEITLISTRYGVNVVYNKYLRLTLDDVLKVLKFFLVRVAKKYENVILLWAYTPLVTKAIVLKAYEELLLNKERDVLITVKEELHRVFSPTDNGLKSIMLDDSCKKVFTAVKSFSIFKSELLIKNNEDKLNIHPFLLDNDIVEIKSYQDWWICSRLLKRKKILFRVIGSDDVGMGHIYRSLTLAHEISDHEIRFITDTENSIAVYKIAGNDYLIEAVEKRDMVDKILSIRPHLVINDILDTEKEYVLRLKDAGIKIVNFEDVGSGAALSDITFNELYETSVITDGNIKWGRGFYFLRDEFDNAKPHRFKKDVTGILVTFGGTDPINLTTAILLTILDFCKEMGIMIYIVAGPGYLFKDELSRIIAALDYDKVFFTFATGVISSIMEKTQIAISSNGRTVYELAHMNITGIIISQNDRETRHPFANEANGFIPVGIYENGVTERVVLQRLKDLVLDVKYRQRLFYRVRLSNFSKNKKKVLKMILNLIEDYE
ncbi:cytidylyltransferase domain-containing protein [Candidatus Magnetominusculus dajiuhuensis]|uniref:cytidylyltransferase domain-containing protein n=1 Tax=Candidatus Magnetominusculus dajiuhuensis TaxID=3137712 RepID=UPI003B432A83